MDESKHLFTLHDAIASIPATQWNALLASSNRPTPFMQHAYLAALQTSGSATAQTGWMAQFATLASNQGELLAAYPLYVKNNSYGEYVFDWAWAQAYQQHGIAYYPKAVIAVPFTPVPGSRILGKSENHRAQLLKNVVQHVQSSQYSSLHLLWGSPQDIALCPHSPHWTTREQVQFHWFNQTYPDFEAYLQSLQQSKRKKIRAEQRKVQQAGVFWQFKQGHEITTKDWDFFYQCYAQTYFEHGNAPYISRGFFASMQDTMPDNWLLCIAHDSEKSPIACSLIALDPASKTAYGRYWGALQRVDCLHFDACYYQPIQWCIQNNYQRFEGGAQGEHKMARGLVPTAWQSAHWVAHPDFAKAIARYTNHETSHTEAYRLHLEERSPYKLDNHD